MLGTYKAWNTNHASHFCENFPSSLVAASAPPGPCKCVRCCCASETAGYPRTAGRLCGGRYPSYQAKMGLRAIGGRRRWRGGVRTIARGECSKLKSKEVPSPLFYAKIPHFVSKSGSFFVIFFQVIQHFPEKKTAGI
ncbi:unnamed protein product [Laminaria digitata]